jgi:hypothetical protein
VRMRESLKSTHSLIQDMSFLSVMGTVIICLSVIGFLSGIYEAVILGSLLVTGLSFLGLAGGVYLGYLGWEVGRLDNAEPTFGINSQIAGLSRKIERLEKIQDESNEREFNTASPEKRREMLLRIGCSEEEIGRMGNLSDLTSEQFSWKVKEKTDTF